MVSPPPPSFLIVLLTGPIGPALLGREDRQTSASVAAATVFAQEQGGTKIAALLPFHSVWNEGWGGEEAEVQMPVMRWLSSWR